MRALQGKSRQGQLSLCAISVFLILLAGALGVSQLAWAEVDDAGDLIGHARTCESGQAWYDPSIARVVRYPDGGSSYTYRVGEGDEETTLTIGQPPKGFRPETATKGNLARYSFPARPEEERDREAWREIVSGYKSAAPPLICEGPSSPEFGYPEGVEYSTLTASRNWSGYMANAPGQPGHFVAARGTFYEPSGNAHISCRSNALVANWVGLGGWNTEALIQAGTGTATNNVHTTWTVWTAGMSYVDNYYPGLAFGAGSYMKFYSGYNKATETVYFYLENGSTGQVIPVSAKISRNYYDGTSAESITEAPSISHEVQPLLNYDYITWWNVTVQNLNNRVANIGEVNNLQIEMTRYGNKEVPTTELKALPEVLSLDQNYGNSYYHCL
jgi:hypothetical protein